MAKNYNYLSSVPIVLESNRVWRTYQGGMKIEEWQGKSNPTDSNFPEEWVASTVKARNAGREAYTDEGLSKIVIDGETVTLKQIIDSDPCAFLGEKHVQKFGNNMAVLLKMLDSKCRLSIQVHPDQEFARNVFNSQFGKTEAWYVLGGREINGEAPYLLFGFKPGVTREKWQELFERQDIQGMINCLHRIPAKPGSLLLIEGGLPHAIGPGCFLVEIQEPTDYTIRVERLNAAGEMLPDQMCHQGAGFERIFDCFHYDGYPLEETLKRWQISPVPLEVGEGFRVTELIGKANTTKFVLHRLDIDGKMECVSNGSFSTLVVLSGSGTINCPNHTTIIGQASMVFLPAKLERFEITANPGQPLVIMRCFPPQ